MKKPFLSAFGLLVAPDFSEVEAGRALPPYVNHNQLDYARLQQTLKKLFRFGSGKIRVANDTIDQVTIHTRMGIVPPQTAISAKAIKQGSAACEDFGQALIKLAQKQKEGVLDAQTAWVGHHCLPDRTYAPPPSMIPFILETIDFEDAIIWLNSTRPCLGLPLLQEYMFEGRNPDNDNQSGTLPAEAKKELEAVFGCPLQSFALVHKLGFSKPPAYAQQMGL